MKKFLNVFFVVLGVIFSLLIIAGIVFYIIDPLGLKPLISGQKSSNTNQTGDNPTLSPAQEKALETIGVDPASIPSSFTPAQEACFTAKLGASRVAEIKAGSSPTASEYFATKSCLE